METSMRTLAIVEIATYPSATNCHNPLGLKEETTTYY